jgi:hypothetical protein
MGEDDRRVLTAWAADCAERVLPIFESATDEDERPRAAVDGARAWVRGEIALDAAQALATDAHDAARAVPDRAARSAARAAGQACSAAQVGAHARHAAAYAVAAIMQAEPNDPGASAAELEWQRSRLSGRGRALAYPDEGPQETPGAAPDRAVPPS